MEDTLQNEHEERDQIQSNGEREPSTVSHVTAGSGADGQAALHEELRLLRGELERLRKAQESSAQVSSMSAAVATPIHSPPSESGHETVAPTNPILAESASPGPWQSRILKLAILVVIAVGALSAPRLWRYMHSYESTDDAQIDGHIVAISSRVAGTVSRVLVENTQFVKAGQILAEIDPRDSDVAVEKARADLDQAQAQVRSARQDYEAGLANLQQSEATNLKAQRDAERYRVLFQTSVVSRGEYENQTRDSSISAAEVHSEHAKAEGAERMIAVREAAARAAQATLDQALLNLSYTRIVASADGVVGKRTVEAGQRVDPGQGLLALVPLDDLWVTANFKETQLKLMRPGQQVTIHVDSTGKDYRGYVEGMPGASGEMYSLLPPENATGNYVKVVQRLPVRIRFYPGQDPEHRLRTGMSVEPSVWLK